MVGSFSGRRRSSAFVASTKRASTASVTLTKRATSKKNKLATKPKISQEGSSIEVSLEKDDAAESDKSINYRNELVLVFFKDMLSQIVEERTIIPDPKSSDKIAANQYDSERCSRISQDVLGAEDSKRIASALSEYESRFRRGSSFSSRKPKSSQAILQKEISEKYSDKNNKMSQEIFKTSGSSFDLVQEPTIQTQKIIFKNGHTYLGETYQCVMHGTGTFCWRDGTVYEGHFKDGYPSGTGKMTLPDLSVYEGDFRKGHFHGSGVFNIVSTPVIYRGEWRNGRKHGKGWLLYGDNEWYEGDWSDDNKHGVGFRRYKNGAKYKGDWRDNRKHGQGSMTWKNNDFYVGEWLRDLPNGYGEYTWNMLFNKSFVFPSYNWYKGSWVDGVRTGIGIMNFGTECGSKLAGTWDNNIKHGPGVVICGNGLILECNPLFINDKPLHMNSRNSSVSLSDTVYEDLREVRTFSGNETFKEISKQINAKVYLRKFSDEILINITQNGLTIPQKQFFKLADSISGNKKLWCPLKIPIHSTAEQIDLQYYVDIIFDHFFKSTNESSSDVQQSPNVSSDNFNYSMDLDANQSIKECQKKTSINSKDEQQLLKKAKEELLLRNIVTIYLTALTQLYYEYATFTANKNIKFKPVLVRLFLWQLLRDLHLPQEGVSLVETDLFLSSNPSSCVETSHYPFEPIYFWQFVQALVGCGWLLFLTKTDDKVAFNTGMVAEIFKSFLENTVFCNSDKFIGSALTESLNMLPIQGVYELYLKVGEPHTVRDFLNNTCTKKGTDPPCYVALVTNAETNRTQNGYNAVPIGHRIHYLNVTGENNPATENEREDNTDIFHKTLYTFRNLERKIIMNCLTTVCPKIQIGEQDFDMNYKISFLEFYEILLLCAYEKVEVMRKCEETRQQAIQRFLMLEAQESFAASIISGKMKDKLSKRKQSKRSIMPH